MIYDTNDNPLSAAQLQVAPSDDETLTIRVECRANYKLSATAAANLAVEARIVGGAGWTNIETGFVDLSPYAGTRRDFEIRLTAGAAASIIRSIFSVKVGL